jgi:hypothetical protein
VQQEVAAGRRLGEGAHGPDQVFVALVELGDGLVAVEDELDRRGRDVILHDGDLELARSEHHEQAQMKENET